MSEIYRENGRAILHKDDNSDGYKVMVDPDSVRSAPEQSRITWVANFIDRGFMHIGMMRPVIAIRQKPHSVQYHYYWYEVTVGDGDHD